MKRKGGVLLREGCMSVRGKGERGILKNKRSRLEKGGEEQRGRKERGMEVLCKERGGESFSGRRGGGLLLVKKGESRCREKKGKGVKEKGMLALGSRKEIEASLSRKDRVPSDLFR